jgi:DNA-binding transcriptional MerR regulator
MELLRISELAKIAGVTVRTVRYYEELGLLPSYERKQSKHRRYTEKDLIYLKRIIQLKGYGLTLQEIGEIIELSKDDPSGEKRRTLLLRRYREKLENALQKKEEMDKYIAELKWHIDQLEKVANFQSCPGSECLQCLYKEKCRFAITNHERRQA